MLGQLASKNLGKIILPTFHHPELKGFVAVAIVSACDFKFYSILTVWKIRTRLLSRIRPSLLEVGCRWRVGEGLRDPRRYSDFHDNESTR